MNFTLNVYRAPGSSQAAMTAYAFAVAAIQSGDRVLRVFFYQDGVQNGNGFITPPQDEPNVPQRWADLAAHHGIDLVVCVAAGLRRGVIDAQEAQRHACPGANLKPPFSIAGLGQLIEGAVQSDRTITFG
jgi:tRNA 2-thiouridine synthesizing protein D